MNHQKVYPTAPSAPIDQQGYNPAPNNYPRPTACPAYPEPQFHILPHPYPYPGPTNIPPPTYAPNYSPGLVPAINPHSIPGVEHKVSYVPAPRSHPGYVPQQGYVPQSTSTLVDRNAFDSGARFNQGARPVLPPCPPGAVPTVHQIAASKGQQVVLGKKKSGWFWQKGAGSVFW